ncbi:hypothetical protein CDD80_5582 [Ophiocordyceps camponoti-rufipedis]|uniref:Uncharacterized protein n=1 Tax=Ophiocordyceps camponoti-rufipedis TaxID=2004952 RepID=A0A2C5ZGH2_9HYPO|nr:hypothetical protein CDD80_5582 [Ophiocordyceps camponoti-rufipedis]
MAPSAKRPPNPSDQQQPDNGARFGGESPLLSNDDLGNLIRFDDESRQSYLDEEALLELCDAARAGLVDGGALAEPLAKRLTDFLAAVVADEAYGIATVAFPVLMHARLDKLVADVSTPDMLDAAQPRRDGSTGRRLQRFWRARFRREYFDIDQMRYADLSRAGRLRHVVFDEHQLWRAIACPVLAGGPDSLQFEAGE